MNKIQKNVESIIQDAKNVTKEMKESRMHLIQQKEQYLQRRQQQQNYHRNSSSSSDDHRDAEEIMLNSSSSSSSSDSKNKDDNDDGGSSSSYDIRVMEIQKMFHTKRIELLYKEQELMEIVQNKTDEEKFRKRLLMRDIHHRVQEKMLELLQKEEDMLTHIAVTATSAAESVKPAANLETRDDEEEEHRDNTKTDDSEDRDVPQIVHLTPPLPPTSRTLTATATSGDDNKVKQGKAQRQHFTNDDMKGQEELLVLLGSYLELRTISGQSLVSSASTDS